VKKKYLFNLSVTCALIFCFSYPCLLKAEELLSEPEVREFFKKMEEILSCKDIGTYEQFLAPDLRIFITAPKGKSEFFRQEYLDNLCTSLSLCNEYTCHFLLVSVKINGNKAIVESKITDKFVFFNGKTASEDSAGKFLLEKRNGKIQQKVMEVKTRAVLP
jgi:hypothetical protein